MEIDESRRGENPFEEPARKLRGVNPEEVARRAGARFSAGRNGSVEVVIPVLSWAVKVLFPAIEISADPPVDSFTFKLLTLLYLSNSDGCAPTGEWVAYRELAGGRFYEPVVRRSVEDPLAERFGSDAGAFLAACAASGGRPEPLGDAACSFELFPLVRAAFILWRGDEEFDARAQVLFDSGATHHLNAFDLRMGSAEIASLLLKWRAGDGG